MKKYFLIPVLIFLLTGCKAHNDKSISKTCEYYSDSLYNHDVYTLADEFPKFKNGIADLYSYINTNIELKEQLTNQYSFNVMMIIDNTGKIINASVNNKKDDYTIMEQEVLRLIKSMPSWEAAKCKNKSVWFKINVPIRLNYK